MAGQLFVLLLRLGYTSGVRLTEVAGKQAVIRGKVVTTRHDRYDISISGAHLNRFLELVGWPTKPRSVIYSRLKVRGNVLEIPLRKVETLEYSGDVYDFEVANDRSFCAPYVTLHNCYATYEWSPDFYDVVYAKTNAANVLERELVGWKDGEIKPVFIASATDCYQPVEGLLRPTRKCVEVLQKNGVPYYISTKSGSILRDLSLHASYRDKCFIVKRKGEQHLNTA